MSWSNMTQRAADALKVPTWKVAVKRWPKSLDPSRRVWVGVGGRVGSSWVVDATRGPVGNGSTLAEAVADLETKCAAIRRAEGGKP